MSDKTGKTKGSKGLTKRQEDFCRLYAALGSPGEAARAAGYPRVAAQRTGLRMLEDPAIRGRLSKLKETSRGKAAALRDTALTGLLRAALESPAGALRILDVPDGEKFGDTAESIFGEGSLLCVSEIKRSKGVTELKFIDRVKALETVFRLANETDEAGSGAADLINALRSSVKGDYPDEP